MSALWSSPWLEGSSTVAEQTLDSLECIAQEEDLEHYASHLRRAFDESPPPFGEDSYGDRFRTLASDPRWMASTLLASATVEGEAARKLWELSACTHDGLIAEQIRLHAIDLSRHARMYVFILRNLFPRLVTDETRGTLIALSPGYGPDDRPTPSLPKAPLRVLDELIQMNLGAIRTRQNLLLLGPALRALCPRVLRVGVNVVLDRLRLDVTRHIHYTARLIEAASHGGKAMLTGDLFLQRTRELNELTRKEIGGPRPISEPERMVG